MTTRRAETEAPAKINLFLRVLDRRDDGFHELETLFQSVSMTDTVRVEVGPERGAAETTIEVSGAEVGPDADNLGLRAARAFRERFPVDGSIHVVLDKRIPAGAGLGGGSSDAAAVLRCLHELTGAGAPHELAEVAAGLGSDVPFFLTPTGLALGRGRGERLVPLPALEPRPLVVAMPDVHVSTAGAYTAVSEERNGAPPPSARALAVQDFASWPGVDALSENDFTSAVVPTRPAISAAIEALSARLPGPVLLSGSGGASFGFAASDEEAMEVAAALAEVPGLSAAALKTLSAPPPVRTARTSPEGKG